MWPSWMICALGSTRVRAELLGPASQAGSVHWQGREPSHLDVPVAVLQEGRRVDPL